MFRDFIRYGIVFALAIVIDLTLLIVIGVKLLTGLIGPRRVRGRARRDSRPAWPTAGP